MIAETECLAVLEKLGLVKKEKMKTCLYIYKEFAEILARNGISTTMAVNIGLEMFLRSRGLYPTTPKNSLLANPNRKTHP